MGLYQIASNLCAQMPKAKDLKLKCGVQFSTGASGTQYVYFTFFFNEVGEETNKSIVFYEFHTQYQHAEKLDKIERFLNGEISAKELYNTALFN